MNLSQDLLEKLACPACRGPVVLREEGRALDCEACRLRFAVEDGIPNMLEDEAQSLEEASA